MRLIDADALDKSIRDWYCVPERCDNYNGVRCRACSIDDALSELDSAPTVDTELVQQWISVKDRLPEVGKVVLAFGTRSATTGMFQGINKRNDLWWWKGHTIKHVSHWMPLPEPPKEENDNEDAQS